MSPAHDRDPHAACALLVLAFGDDAARVLFGSGRALDPEPHAGRWAGSGPKRRAGVPLRGPGGGAGDPVAPPALPRRRAVGAHDGAPSGGPPPWDGTYTVVETLEEARAADAACRAARRTSFDLETNGAHSGRRAPHPTVSLAPPPRTGLPPRLRLPGGGVGRSDPRGAILRALLKGPPSRDGYQSQVRPQRHGPLSRDRGPGRDLRYPPRGPVGRAGSRGGPRHDGLACRVRRHKERGGEALATAKSVSTNKSGGEEGAGSGVALSEEKLSRFRGSPRPPRTGTSAPRSGTATPRATRSRRAVSRQSSNAASTASPPEAPSGTNVIRHATEPFHRIEARGFPLTATGSSRSRTCSLSASTSSARQSPRSRRASTRTPPRKSRTTSTSPGADASLSSRKAGRATDREALTYLADEHPVAARIAAYSELVHFRGIYLGGTPDSGKRYGTTGMLTLHSPGPARDHGLAGLPPYRLTGAVTGRLSSSEAEPPKHPARGDGPRRAYQGMFIAPPGWKILQVDYSQLGSASRPFSRRAEMAEIFPQRRRYHLRTAEFVCDPRWAKLDKDAQGPALAPKL